MHNVTMSYTRKHRTRGFHTKRKRKTFRRNRRRRTIHGGESKQKFLEVDYTRNLIDPNNIKLIVRATDDPIFPPNIDRAVAMRDLVDERTGEVDEFIEAVKRGRKDKPSKRRVYRFTYKKTKPITGMPITSRRKCSTATHPV
jgi:hypothetical protein